MRSKKGHRRNHTPPNIVTPSDCRAQYAIQANTVNIMNVTNVSGSGAGNGWRPKRHKRKGKGRGRDRPPALFNYCASCGILDQDVAAGIDDSRMVEEGAAVVRYSARQLAHTVGKGARGVSEGLCEAASGLVGLGGSIISLAKALFR